VDPRKTNKCGMCAKDTRFQDAWAAPSRGQERNCIPPRKVQGEGKEEGVPKRETWGLTLWGPKVGLRQPYPVKGVGETGNNRAMGHPAPNGLEHLVFTKCSGGGFGKLEKGVPRDVGAGRILQRGSTD